MGQHRTHDQNKERNTDTSDLRSNPRCLRLPLLEVARRPIELRSVDILIETRGDTKQLLVRRKLVPRTV